MLLKSSADAKNTRLSNHDISKLVDEVFAKHDYDHDGQLSFTEFKNAFCSHSLVVNPFWMSTSFKFGGEKANQRVQFIDQILCAKCKRPFFPNGLSLDDKYCEKCKDLMRSPYSAAKFAV